VQPELADGGQLMFERIVQILDNSLIALHRFNLLGISSPFRYSLT
jgi:hypothetical protein